MKTRAGISILALFALSVFGTGSALARTGQQHGTEKPIHHDMATMDMDSMMIEPHHVLAMTYMHTVGAFAHSLHHQALAAAPLDAAFARAAVDEIKRSFDEMEKHHAEHVKTMSEEKLAKMSAMMKKMDTHRAMLSDAVGALEKDVRADQLDSGKVAADCANVLRYLDEMSMVHPDK